MREKLSFSKILSLGRFSSAKPIVLRIKDSKDNRKTNLWWERGECVDRRTIFSAGMVSAMMEEYLSMLLVALDGVFLDCP